MTGTPEFSSDGIVSGRSIVRVALTALLVLLSACGPVPMTHVESTNQNSRINYLVIHATSEDFAESLRLLATPTANPVSSHYLVPAPGDPSYTESTLRVYSLVGEERRAWHAGVSFWDEEVALNNSSIGVEIVNEFECTAPDRPVEQLTLEQVNCEFLPFPEAQIDLTIRLLQMILANNPGIDPIDVVGHSDIAIGRRSDPGPLFPWKRLYEAGIGIWPDEELAAMYIERFNTRMPTPRSLQSALLALGYEIEVTGEMDVQTGFALRAFQLRFRPSDYAGSADVETAALLWALLEEYRPETVDAL